MATLALAAAGSALGSSIGGGILGVSSALIGQAAGAALGSVIDNRLLAGGSSTVKREGPRLENLDVMTSQEGAALPEIVGRSGVAGSVIWAARLQEDVITEREEVGSGKQTQTVENTSYRYSASFAIALGEGPVRHFGRIWADGRLWDFGQMIRERRVRFYHGTENQAPDELIEAIEGWAPAYRGTAYIVFEDLPLAEFGNRVPQIKVEVFGQSGTTENLVRGINIIPGSTEWGYMPKTVRRTDMGEYGDILFENPENANRYNAISDWEISMDQADRLLPNCDTASLVVAWFGTDLRAGLCEVEPRVEFQGRNTTSIWSVDGLSNEEATEVSRTPAGRPAYGSTPDDDATVEAIRDLKERGKRVVLYPFIMMDITDDQALPHPSGSGVQGAYPWRGRIEPRAGEDVAAEVSAFYASFRRFILHLADLAERAGGVDAFLIGSEMRGLTMARAADGSYPFVDRLRDLAAEVRAKLPGAKISYAADWSEYHSDRSGGDVRFHLDPLWADGNIDFVGIDNYLPLSDWRASQDHADLDHENGITSPYNLDYLKSNIEGGEYWDFYYPDHAARVAQNRIPISDGAHGEPWVFRQKAIRDWHRNRHHERIGGVRQSSATSWIPGSKPVWFTEIGCPAVDLGANQPNVFVARISSESALPYFSGGTRDDYMQRQALRASLEWWRDNGAEVVDPADIQVWCWDARPWPEFPQRTSVWSDGEDWRLGHWLNGRAGAAPAREAITRRLARHGFTAADLDLAECHGQADGYVTGAPLSFRDFAQPLEIALGLAGRETGGRLAFAANASARRVAQVDRDGMVEASDGDQVFTAKRSDLVDVPGAAIMRFRDGVNDYQATAVREAVGAGSEFGEAEVESPLILDYDRGHAAVTRILRAATDGRETLSFAVPRSARHVVPGAIVPVALPDRPVRLMEVLRVVDGAARGVEARSFSRGAFAPGGGVGRPTKGAPPAPARSAILVPLDLPEVPGLAADPAAGFFAAYAAPWPGAVSIARALDAGGPWAADSVAGLSATMGRLAAPLEAAGSATWTAGPLVVDLFSGSFVTRSEAEVLAGANALAVQHAAGWEVVQFRSADLTAEGWRLTGLLRGRRGTEHLAESDLGQGARVVALNRAVTPAGLLPAEIGRPFWYRYGPTRVDKADHATLSHTFGGVGLRPFSPAHLRAIPDGGDLRIEWIRRTRSTASTWWSDGVEVPLGEAAERYRIEVGPEGAPVRVEEVEAPSWTYTAADQSADGITGETPIRVAQISETYGPGIAAALTWSF